MAHGQRDVVRGSGELCLADADGAVAVLVEICQELPEPQWLGSGDDAERPIRLPAPLPRLQQLILYRSAHQGGHATDMTGLNRGATGHRGGAEKHDSSRRLLREALEEPVDHEAAQAMPHKMQPGDAQVPYEFLQARGDLGHAGSRGRVSESMDLEPELTCEPAPQQQRLATRHPQAVNVDYRFPHIARQSWCGREHSAEADITKKRRCEVRRRRASEQ